MTYGAILAVAVSSSVVAADDSYYASDILTGSNGAILATITGAPTGGSFILTYGAQATAAIPFNATAAQVQAALVLLSSINAGGVVVGVAPGGNPGGVAGVAGGPWIISFAGPLKNSITTAMTISTNSFSGGATPNMTFGVLITGAATGLSANTDLIISFTPVFSGGSAPYLVIYMVDLTGNLTVIGRADIANPYVVIAGGAGRSYGGKIQVKAFAGQSTPPVQFALSIEAKGTA